MRPDYASASGDPGLKFAKGTTRREDKASADYRERLVMQRVKSAVKRRDGHCRLEMAAQVVGDCMGHSSWQHYTKRSATMGMMPEERHNTATSGMNCERHHRMIDEHEINFEYLTEKGADGRMAFVLKATGLRYEELEGPRKHQAK